MSNLDDRKRDFEKTIRQGAPNIGDITLARLTEAFESGYTLGQQDKYLELTTKESEPIAEHVLGDRIL